MHISFEEKKKALLIHIKGRLDAQVADDLMAYLATLIQKGKIHLVIDCKEISYLSSGGMRAFLHTLHLVEEKKGSISFYGFCETVQEVLDLAGITKYFPILHDLNDL